MPDDPNKYALDAATSERIFRTEIIPDLFFDAAPQKNPCVVFLGGQPGAGKSATFASAAHELAKRGGVVAIAGDDLRHYHPRYNEFLATDDQTMATFTQFDASRWVSKALDHAAENRLNVVFETTMRVPESVATELKRFQNANYEIDAKILAVNPALSEQGVLARYVDQVRENGSGRIVPHEYHNVAVAGLLDSADKLQDERLVDHVHLYRRGNVEIGAFDLTKPKQPDEPRVRTAIETEHQRIMTADERERFHRVATGLNEYAISSVVLNDTVKERIANSLKVAELNMTISESVVAPEDKRTLTIIAGPAGAGKTTLAKTLGQSAGIVDARRIARDLRPEQPEAVQSEAIRESLMRSARLMAEGKTFAHETSLESVNALNLIQSAKNVGYKVDLHYIGFDSPDETKQRLDLRADCDGSPPPSLTHVKSFTRDQAKLPLAIASADTATLYDNTGKAPIVVARLANGKPVEVNVDAPKWAISAIALSQQPKIQTDALRPDRPETTKPKL